MTTTHDTDGNTHTIAAASASDATESAHTYHDTGPDTPTAAAAWASSPLGQPDGEVRNSFPTTGPTESVVAEYEPQSAAKRAVVAAALACGVIGGAAFGVMLFDYSDTTQPTVVVPGSESRLPGPMPTETRTADAAVPNPVAPQRQTAPTTMVAAAPSEPGTADVGKPPVGAEGDTTVVVDIPIPEYPPLPEKPDQNSEDPDPEPPKPEPPVLDDPNFKLPEPPKPEPDPDPPVFVPDLPLAPVPNPDPVIQLPLAPLNPQPEPPTISNFAPPAGFGS